MLYYLLSPEIVVPVVIALIGLRIINILKSFSPEKEKLSSPKLIFLNLKTFFKVVKAEKAVVKESEKAFTGYSDKETKKQVAEAKQKAKVAAKKVLAKTTVKVLEAKEKGKTSDEIKKIRQEGKEAAKKMINAGKEFSKTLKLSEKENWKLVRAKYFSSRRNLLKEIRKDCSYTNIAKKMVRGKYTQIYIAKAEYSILGKQFSLAKKANNDVSWDEIIHEYMLNRD